MIGCPIQVLVHDSINLVELWHRRFAHLHYRALPTLSKMVTRLPELQVEHDGVAEDVHLARMPRDIFRAMTIDPRGCLWTDDSSLLGWFSVLCDIH